MNLGLKGQMESIHKDLEKIRSGHLQATGAIAGKRDVTLVEYLSATRPEGCTRDGVFDIQHLYNELGVNPNKMTIEQLIDLDQDSRWLVPEIFRDAIRKGLRTSPFYNKITAISEPVAQPQANLPYLDLSDATPAETRQGETISKGTVTYGNKVVNITKKAIGIEIVDEALKYSSINLVTIFIQDVGIKLGQLLNNSAVDVLINGDQSDGSEDAAVIGIENTTTGLIYSDLLYAWIRASRLGRRYTSMIAGERVANTILNLTEFKDKQAGTPQQSIAVNEILPAQSQLFVSAQVPANQLIMLDPSLALVQLTSAALNVEADRIVNKQINGSYASITTGFANIFRDARVIIDRSIVNSYDGVTNDFPAYMTPTL